MSRSAVRQVLCGAGGLLSSLWASGGLLASVSIVRALDGTVLPRGAWWPGLLQGGLEKGGGLQVGFYTLHLLRRGASAVGLPSLLPHPYTVGHCGSLDDREGHPSGGPGAALGTAFGGSVPNRLLVPGWTRTMGHVEGISRLPPARQKPPLHVADAWRWPCWQAWWLVVTQGCGAHLQMAWGPARTNATLHRSHRKHANAGRGASGRSLVSSWPGVCILGLLLPVLGAQPGVLVPPEPGGLVSAHTGDHPLSFILHHIFQGLLRRQDSVQHWP